MFEENQDGGYRTGEAHQFTMYSVCLKTTKMEAVAATLELMCAESYKSVTPVIFELALKVKYSNDSVDSEMFDYIKDGITFEIARFLSVEFGNEVVTQFRKTCLADTLNYNQFQLTLEALATGSIPTVNASFVNQQMN